MGYPEEENISFRKVNYASIAIAGVVLVVAAGKRMSAAKDPMAPLLAAQRESREVEPRLSGGFRWTPLKRAAEPKPNDRGPLAVLRAADVSVPIEGVSPPALHARALARILEGNPRAAIAVLQSLATASDADMANDLGAAQYMLALRDSDASHLQAALVATDAALRMDPRLLEARFNRALIIEALGLRDLARDAWSSYLGADSSSGWAAEARSHLAALAPEEGFNAALARQYEHLAADPDAARAFARRYRQRARMWGEAEILGDWARAMRQSDAGQAAKHLRVAREFGAELAAGGDGTLQLLVEAIDAGSPAQRTSLADAHLHLSDGLRAYRDRRPADAEPLLAAAAREFARGASPGELRARHFLAGTLFLHGRFADCGAAMKAIVASLPATFLGPRAEGLWILASVAVSEGRWGEAIDHWSESLRIYDRLDERNNAAIIRQQLVFTFDRLGNPARAWQYRMPALRELGRELSTRQQEAIGSLARAAMMDHDWPAAASFARLEVEAGRKVNRTSMLIESLLYRAEVQSRVGDMESAKADLREARGLIPRVPDASFRQGVEWIADVVEASLTDPRSAIVLLSRTIEYHSTRGRRMYLPDLFQRRGHCFRALGDDARAAADFEAGVAELERHRATISPGEDRWGVFHAADALFGDAISLSLKRGDVATAFNYSERARARSLFDTLQSSWRPVTTADIPARTALVEYALHDDRLFVFVLDARGLRALSLSVDRRALRAGIADLRRANARDGERFRLAARTLYQRLIEPVERELIGKESLVIVPDPALQSVSFPALLDGAGHYLVERYAIALQPSAAFLAAGRPALATASDILVVEGGDDAGRLAAADREGRAVAALYRKSTLLDRAHATRATLVRLAQDAGSIHFAGHGFASDGSNDGYLLLAEDGDDGRLTSKEIVSLPLAHTSLVVLAACDTAAGEIRSTEGTISVARAFLAAGVPSVIATLWPIEDDESAEFFPVLHQNLARGMAPKDALRATQIEWIRRGRPPALWAAVELTGK